MPGKYDPDQRNSDVIIKKSKKMKKMKWKFMTDEEWWDSDEYKKVRDQTIAQHKRLKAEGKRFN